MIKILYDDEQRPEEGLTELFERAAALAAEREKIGQTGCEVSLFFAEPEEIRQMNREYRGIDEPTDVLSFSMVEDLSSDCTGIPLGLSQRGDKPMRNSRLQYAIPVLDAPVLLGDIVICRKIAEEQAKEFGHSAEREVVFLFTHGLLHLFGYDHDEESGEEMRAAEKEIMEGLGI